MSSDLFVVVCGPDGAGKSSITAMCAESLRTAGPVRHIHFMPFAGDSATIVDPHAKEPRRRLGGLLSVVHRWIRYVRDRDLRPLARRNGTLLQERGWFDQCADPRRYRLLPEHRWVVQLLGRLTTTPDLMVFCVGDPAEIAQRKSEMSEEATAAQIEHYRTARHRTRAVLWLDTVEQSPDECLQLVMRSISVLRTGSRFELRRLQFVPRRLEYLRSARDRSELVLYRPSTSIGAMRSVAGRSLPALRPRSIRADALGLLESLCPENVSAVQIARSSGRDQWIAALLDGDHVFAYAKLGDRSSSGIGRELAFLDGCESKPEGIIIPSLTAHASVGALDGFVLGPVPLGAARPTVDIELALTVSATLATWRGGVVHGDFAPWNLYPGYRPVLLDWEHAIDKLDPGFDIAFYVIASIAMRSGISVKQGAELLKEDDLLRRYSEITRIDITKVRRGAAHAFAVAADRGAALQSASHRLGALVPHLCRAGLHHGYD